MGSVGIVLAVSINAAGWDVISCAHGKPFQCSSTAKNQLLELAKSSVHCNMT